MNTNRIIFGSTQETIDFNKPREIEETDVLRRLLSPTNTCYNENDWLEQTNHTQKALGLGLGLESEGPQCIHMYSVEKSLVLRSK
jgi:hypothetical protein